MFCVVCVIISNVLYRDANYRNYMGIIILTIMGIMTFDCVYSSFDKESKMNEYVTLQPIKWKR